MKLRNISNQMSSNYRLIPYNSMFSYANPYSVHSNIKDFKNFLDQFKFYKFETSKIRNLNPAQKAFTLAEDGQNLAQVLLTLHSEKKKVFYKIEEILKILIDEVDELLTPLTNDGKTYIAYREKSKDESYDYLQISDGTLKLLAFITAINLESSIICIEEPENFIHPSLLKSLIEILTNSDKQVIITTHSPYLLEYVKLEDLIVIEKDTEGTKARRIDKDEHKERIKDLLASELSLGELYYSGSL